MSPERKTLLDAVPGWLWQREIWAKGFLHLKEFAGWEGHCMVPQNYHTGNGYPLGQWVIVQRNSKDSMSPENKKRLETISSWAWDSSGTSDEIEQWDVGFYHLKEFVRQVGHAYVPTDYKTADGYRLGQWINRQRNSNESITTECRLQLEALPGWNWSAIAAEWENGFRHLKKFADQDGHSNVLRNYKTVDGYPLGQWVCDQRKNKNAMSPELKVRLAGLPNWSWSAKNASGDNWEKGFHYLKEFINQKGSCEELPREYVTEDGYCLGKWVATQRSTKSGITFGISFGMSPERKARLEALPGWVWRVRDGNAQ